MFSEIAYCKPTTIWLNRYVEYISKDGAAKNGRGDASSKGAAKGKIKITVWDMFIAYLHPCKPDIFCSASLCSVYLRYVFVVRQRQSCGHGLDFKGQGERQGKRW